MLSFLKNKQKVSEDTPSMAVKKLFSTLQKLGLSPVHIVDIGANRGGWTRTVLSVFPQAKISIFEPQTRLAEFHKDLVENPNIEIIYKGVGSADGTSAFTFHDRDDSCSFVYESEDALERGFDQSEIEICRLDTAIATSRFGAPDVVKIDAEGLDLEVLEGGTDTLQTANVVLVEASIANPDYPNTLLTVLQKMDELGFRLFDFTDLNRSPSNKVLWLVEAVFVKKGSAIEIAGTEFK